MLLTTATHARSDFFELLKSAIMEHEIYHIKHRKGNAVLMSEEEYESMLETMELLSSPKFKKSMQRSFKQLKKGEVLPMEEVFK